MLEPQTAADSAAAPSAKGETPAPRPRRWARWLLGAVALLVVVVLVAQQLLDPWLRRTLEKQVSKQTHGQYRLQVGEFHTSFFGRAIRLRGLRLRPAAAVADTLPRLRLDVDQLNITGVGLLALLRKSVVPIDSVVLESARVEVLALATKPTKNSGKPLYQRLPLKIKGLQIGYLGLLHTQGSYLPGSAETAQFKRADLTARDLLISPAGAADTQRLGFAAAWGLQLLQAKAQLAGHRLDLGGLQLSTDVQQLQLDSVRIQPNGPSQPNNPRVDLVLQRLRLTGLNAAALRQHRFAADSLLLQRPRLTFTPPAQTPPKGAKPGSEYLQRLDLAHLAVRQGFLRVAGIAQAPVIRGIEVGATAIHFDAAAKPDSRRFFFAKDWDVALGRSQATMAAHALTLGSMHLSTAAGTFGMRAVRIRPPAPGQGKPGGVRVDLTLPSLAIAGLDAAALQHQHHFQAKSVVLNGPQLNFTPPTQPPPPVWKLLSTFLRRSDLALLRVQHADMQVGGMRHSPEIHNLNVTGRAIRIDSLAALEPRRIAYARAWQANSGLIGAPFDPPYYRATSQHMRLDTDAKTMRFEDMALTPKYSAVGMNLHKGYQAPSIKVNLAALTASGLDFAALVRRRDFRIALVTVQSPLIKIASDGRGPINPNLSKVTAESMRLLKVIVDVRRLDIKDGNLYSIYRSPLTPIPGTLSINRFNGSFYNLSNDPKRQTPATPLTGQASTYLQNQCRLEAQVSMYLLDPLGRHHVWGAFGPGPFSMLNAMTVPTRLVKFKSGNVQRLRFDLHADRKQVTGTMVTEYTGLQMTLLSYKEEEVKKSLFSRIKSKAVNVIVIRDENPRKGGKVVSGEMTSTREPRFSMFTLWRQGMVSGLFNNVGVPQKLAQKLSETKDEGPLPK
ncbi:hypothetical protein AUC43_12000 [Hymenobacter sedentarius]|uniref:Uncharacterized protein n=1 Tax=Hymenobacter sedentarius TaxID=1411621 RepID=A0A0U4AQA0_9BACT|nr:hypothetical protein [Hymenobacter sedentarius]ALW85749.1 hypothetical protein AUC43_12000 [Hymenobacter sedentarius]